MTSQIEDSSKLEVNETITDKATKEDKVTKVYEAKVYQTKVDIIRIDETKDKYYSIDIVKDTNI